METNSRFWSKVDKTGDCWTWTAALSSFGYGMFRYRGNMQPAHRVAWELTSGAPGGMSVLHKCDNPPCVNPDHLFLGTDADNVADKMSKGRHRFRPHGGASNGMSKLSDDEVFLLRRVYAPGGFTSYQLADIFGVNASTVMRAIKHQSWRVAA